MKETVYVLYLLLFLGIALNVGIMLNYGNKWNCVEGKCEMAFGGKFDSKRSCETSCSAAS